MTENDLFLPSSEDEVLPPGRFEILGEDRFRDDLDAPEPFLETRLDSDGVWDDLTELSPLRSNSIMTFCRKKSLLLLWLLLLLLLLSEGTGELELVGVWVLDAFRDDFRVKGDCNIRCFHSRRRFIDSSRWNQSINFNNWNAHFELWKRQYCRKIIVKKRSNLFLNDLTVHYMDSE